MKSDIAICVDHISKKFRLGQDAGYSRLSESLQSMLTGWVPSRKVKSGAENSEQNNNPNQFWALKDVNFEVQQGEVLGIIGRNGAGKSTLLKILSRITRPTTGRIGTRGRVGSLLEVGTGFHPELTGRENIFLNGSILGMKRADIARKFNEIVAFAELEDFIDTPVKRYSSGMYARLAFSVAAYLEPEILIIDEVLAVGDAAFQKQCLGKMSDVAKQGRTVLFVSHNMAAIKTLCQRVLVLDQGSLRVSESVSQAIEKYLGLHKNQSDVSSVLFENCTTPLKTIHVSLFCQAEATNRFMMGDEIDLEIKFTAQSPIQELQIGFELNTDQGECVIASSSSYLSSDKFSAPTVAGTVHCSLGMVPLMPGSYQFSFWIGPGQQVTDVFRDAIQFEIIENNIWETTVVANHDSSNLWWPTKFKFSVDSMKH